MSGVSVRIGSNTSEFQRQMTQMRQQLKQTQSEFSVSATRAKLFGTETEKLGIKAKELQAKLKGQTDILALQKSRTKELTDIIGTLNTKQTELKTKIDDITKKHKESVKEKGEDAKETKVLAEELKNLQQEYGNNQAKIENSNSQLQKNITNTNNTEKAILNLKRAIEDNNKALENGKWDEFNNKLEKINGVSEKVASATDKGAKVVEGAFAGAIASELKFEDSISKLSSLMDTSQVSVGDMKKGIMELSNQTGISANDIAEQCYQGISAGQDTANVLGFVSENIKLSKTGFTQLSDAMNLSTTIQNSYKLGAGDLQHTMDTLNTAQDKGKLSIGQLAGTMGDVIPIASSMNVNLDNLASAYATTTKNGISCEKSTTAIKGVLNELGKEGSKSSAILKNETGKSFSELMASGKSLDDVLSIVKVGADKSGTSINDCFANQEAKLGALSLIQNSDDFKNSLEAMGNSAGTTDKKLGDLANNNTTLKQSWNEVKNAGIKFGEALAPYINDVANGIKKITDHFANMSQEEVWAWIKGGLALLAINKIAIGISSVIGSIRGIHGAIVFIKGLNVIGSISKGWEAIKGLNIFGHISGFVSGVGGLFKGLFGLIMAHPVVAVSVVVIGALVTMYNKCEWFRDSVNGVFGWIKGIFTDFDGWLQGVFTTDWCNSFGIFGEYLNGFFKNCSNIWGSIKEVFGGVIDFIGGVFTGDWSRAWQGVVNVFKGIWDGIVGILKVPLNGVIGLINGVISAINSISVDIPDFVPKFGGSHLGFNLGKISYLYTGGIVTSPTQFGNTVVGDRFMGQGSNAEAVLPLDSFYKHLDDTIARSGNQAVYVDVHVDNNMDSRKLTEALTSAVTSKISKDQRLRR